MVLILVVDDDQYLREDVCSILQFNGYTTKEAANGKQALFNILAEPPDIVLCDVHMPEMNGYELFQQLQCDADYTGIPFVFVSGVASMKDLQEGTNRNIVAFLTKPFSIDALLATVSNLLSSTV